MITKKKFLEQIDKQKPKNNLLKNIYEFLMILDEIIKKVTSYGYKRAKNQS